MTSTLPSRARHRADVRPTTFLTDMELGRMARRGTVSVAAAGLAFGLVAPAASANDPGPSGDQGGGAEVSSTSDSGSGGAEVSSTSNSGSDGASHTVSAGETVGQIASTYGASIQGIIDANGLNGQALIFPGDELTIPGGSGGSGDSGQTQQAAEDSESSADGSADGDSGGASVQPASYSGGGDASGVLDIARQHIGTPYVWGGAAPGGFDCSGFTQYVFAQVGIELPRTTDAQRNAGQVISASEAQPGDLVWWPGHVGIYTGDGNHIAARNPSKPLTEGPVEYAGTGEPTYIRVA